MSENLQRDPFGPERHRLFISVLCRHWVKRRAAPFSNHVFLVGQQQKNQKNNKKKTNNAGSLLPASTRKQAKPFEPLWQLLVDVLLKRRIVCRLSLRTEGVWGRREESGPDWAYLLLKQGTLLQSGSLKGDSEPQLCGHRRLYFLWQNRDSWRQYTLASLSPLFSFLSGFLHSLSPPQSQPHFPKPSQTQSRNNLFHAYILAFWGLGVFLQWNAKYYSL